MPMAPTMSEMSAMPPSSSESVSVCALADSWISV
jgi:hypothetical protein